jgi:hypothetical protein
MMSALLFLMLLSPKSNQYQEVMSAAGLSEDERRMLSDFKAGVTKAAGEGEESIGEGLNRLAD